MTLSLLLFPTPALFLNDYSPIRVFGGQLAGGGGEARRGEEPDKSKRRVRQAVVSQLAAEGFRGFEANEVAGSETESETQTTNEKRRRRGQIRRLL